MLEKILPLRSELWVNGYRPVAVCNFDSDPLRSPGKRPVGFGWALRARQSVPEAATVPARLHGQNTGILCDGLRALDIDFGDVETSAALSLLAFRMLGQTILRTRRTSGKVLLLYRAALGEPRKRALVADHGKIEVLGYGQQFVAFGTHDSGATLEWTAGSPAIVPRDSLPPVTEEQIGEYLEAARAIVGADAVVNATEDTRHSTYGFTSDMSDIASAMQVIPNNGPADWNAFNRMGMALWAATEGSEQGFDLYNAWAEQSAFYDYGAVARQWSVYPASPPDRIGAGTLFFMAREADPTWRRPSAAQTGGAEFDALPAPAVEELAYVVLPEMTHDITAVEFALRHAGQWIYDHTDGVWFGFTRERGWKQDVDAGVTRAVRAYLRKAREHWGLERSEDVAKRSFWSAVEGAAQSEPGMAKSHASWSTDPWVLGTPGGHIDLLTGRSHAPAESMLLRRRTAVEPAAGACPVWTRFVSEATGGDDDMAAWLQRFAGYALTGDVSEEIFAFAFGPGQNGKGVFLHTLASILGEYAFQAPAELFKADSRVNKEYQIAKLDGVRLLLASETEEGAPLAEAFVKEITGNEGEINARHPFGRPFQFRSQAKLLIVGNHAPSLRGRSPAMERRMRVLPFNHVPPQPDPDLKAKLAVEYPQIFAWMIEGCLAWQRDRLGMCAAVKHASGQYFEDQDTIGGWMGDRCSADPAHSIGSTAALEDYNMWLRDRGEKQTTAKAFKETMLRVKGVGTGRSSSGTRYTGFCLRTPEIEMPTAGSEFMALPAELVH